MKASYWKIVSLCVVLSMLALLPTLVSADAPRRTVAEALPMMRVAKFDGHMRTPHEGQIINLLREHRVVRPDATAEELRAAIDEFMVEWAKRNPTTVNPEKLRQLLRNERLAAEAGKSPKAMGLAVQDMKVLIALVEFPGEDTFTITVDNPDYDPEDPESPECIDEEVTTSGPLHNEIVVGPRDNNTFWMSDFTPDVYDELFFGVGPEAGVIADHPNVGDVDLRGYTVANYFLEQSEGTFIPEGYVYPKWLQAAHSEGWYGYDDCVTGSRYPRARDLVRETVDLINADDPEFPWQDFDSDGDGLVDSYTVVHAGMGQEGGGGAQGTFSLWSHSASINWPDGYLACEAGSVGCPDRDIRVLDYGMDPENADTGVLAEEFGHAAWGLPDIYVTDYQASVANWSLMESGAWNGPLGGMIPAPFVGWMRYFVGWWDPVVVEYDDPETETMIGQLSLRPEGTEQGMKVNLPDAVRFLLDPYAGENMWWGGQGDLMDNAVRHTVDLTGKTEASVGFWTFFETEEGWDFGFVQVSTDGGQTWTSLENEDTTSEHDPGAIDTVLANLPGLTGQSDDWVYEEFDLTPYVGQEIWLQFRYITDWGYTERGFFIDDITITADDEDIFFDDVEAGPGEWVADPEDGWVITTGTDRGVQYYLVEWRNLSGFDEGLQYPYQTVYSDEDDWEVDRAPYTVPGMLLYHRNTLYAFDYTLSDSWFDAPSWGPKHALLVVDSHSFPYMFDDYYYDSGQNLRTSPRVAAGDATFTLQETTPFTIRLGYDPETGEYVDVPLEEKEFGPQPAVSAFHDSMGYYPGIWCCDDEGYLIWWDVDASAVVPAKADYTTRLTDLDNDPLYAFWGIDIGTVLGSGNPGDDAVQYGVHLEVVDQAEDGSWGQVRFWNSMKELDASLEADATEAMKDDVLTYTCLVEENIGSAVDALAVIPLDTAQVKYVPGSAFGGAVPMPSHLSAAELAELYASGGMGAVEALAADADAEIGSIVWTQSLRTGEGADEFGFSAEVVTGGGEIDMMAHFFDDGEAFQMVDADTVSVRSYIYLPLIFKSYEPPAIELTILHTNDTHARLESFQPFGEVLQGGVARRYTAIQEVKAEGGNVILVDAGDAFQGTLFFNVWQGEEEAYFMNALGYQAMAVGNHEFDSGPAPLGAFIGLADFPVLSANIDASAEPTLAGLIQAYTILDVAGEQIGVFGLTTEEAPILSSPGPNVVFNDSVAAAEATVATLEGMGINKIVALSHVGYDEDQALAAAVDGIDVIVGGHDHALLGSMEDAWGPYPTVVDSPSGDPVLIVSAYEWGKYLGRLNVVFSADGEVMSYSGEPIFIDESFAEDATIAADVATFAEAIEDLKNTVIGQSAVLLEGTRALVRSQETNLGNLFCDALLWKTAEEDTQICIQNGGGIRASIPPGDVTMGQVLEVEPFGNQIATFGLSGSDVWAALENGVSQWEGGAGRFAQVGGLKYVFDPSLPVGSRIVSVQVKNGDGTYEAIDPDTVYKLASNNFIRKGGDGYSVFAKNAIDPYDGGAVLADALAEYIGAHSPVSPVVEGRITKLDKLITILHTNDTHGNWVVGSYRGSPNGFTLLASHIAAERAKNPNTLLLDAGDTFQGNAFAQYFRNATPNPIAEGLNLLGYDAFTVGNHEFNFGPTTFSTMLAQLDMPILGAANLDDDGTYGFVNDSMEDYITLEVDGLKVAIFGVTNSRVPRYELPTNIPGLTFYDAVATAQSLVPQILADEDPDLLIGLTHIGYEPYAGELDSDKLIAEGVAGIDVIVGGHSHTQLDRAVMLTSDINPDGTLVGHAYRYAHYLGKINVGFTGNDTDGYEIVLREGYLLPADADKPEAAMTAFLAPFVAELASYTSTEIGQTTAPLDALEAYTEETTGANVQCDAAVWELADNGIDVDFHLSGAMSNRKVADDATPENPVTLTIDDMYTLMPYENSLVAMSMNGPQIKSVLERAYRNYYYYKYVEDHGGYSYYTTCMLDINAGGVITYRDAYPELPDGDNVVSLVINGTAVDFSDADTYYNVSSVNYLAAGSCNFNDDGVTIWPLDQITADTQFYVRDSVIDYIVANTPISPQVEGRLVFSTGQ